MLVCEVDVCFTQEDKQHGCDLCLHAAVRYTVQEQFLIFRSFLVEIIRSVISKNIVTASQLCDLFTAKNNALSYIFINYKPVSLCLWEY